MIYYLDEFTSGSFMIENHNDGQLMGFPGVNTTQIFKISHQGNISLVNHITASGNISCSGTVIADNFTSTGGDDQITFTDDLFIDGHITASGNISSSGTVFAEHLRSSDDASIEDQLTAGRIHSLGIIQADSHITASGKISSSNAVIANQYRLKNLDILTETGNTVFLGDTGGGSLPLEILNKTKIHGTANITSHITASGNISASGDITANAITNGGFRLGAINALGANSNNLQLGNNDLWTNIQYGRDTATKHNFKGHITSSGNISSSNTVTALQFIQDGGASTNIFSGSLYTGS